MKDFNLIGHSGNVGVQMAFQKLKSGHQQKVNG
jgi:hypothetical protein